MDSITPKIDFKVELAGLYDLAGLAAYVPGGYGGLGEAIAWGLALRGAKVMLSGRDGGKAEALAGDIRAAGFEAEGVAMDAHSVADIRVESAPTESRSWPRLLVITCRNSRARETATKNNSPSIRSAATITASTVLP